MLEGQFVKMPAHISIQRVRPRGLGLLWDLFPWQLHAAALACVQQRWSPGVHKEVAALQVEPVLLWKSCFRVWTSAEHRCSSS
eukprot:1558250-Pleurochrysis_carterae.AAC.2